MIAGTDLKITGKLYESDDLSVQGINYAKHQISFSGSPTIYGVVIAANQGDTNSPGCGCNPVTLSSDYMNIGGSPTITYAGDYLGGGTDTNNWREVRY